MTSQALNGTSYNEVATGFGVSSELEPLVQSLRSILKQIDEEYERERDKLERTLPDTPVTDRAVAMLKAGHQKRRENYVRELTAILGGA